MRTKTQFKVQLWFTPLSCHSVMHIYPYTLAEHIPWGQATANTVILRVCCIQRPPQSRGMGAFWRNEPYANSARGWWLEKTCLPPVVRTSCCPPDGQLWFWLCHARSKPETASSRCPSGQCPPSTPYRLVAWHLQIRNQWFKSVHKSL